MIILYAKLFTCTNIQILSLLQSRVSLDNKKTDGQQLSSSWYQSVMAACCKVDK